MKLFDTLKNIWKIEELKTRILTTLGLILVYRLGTEIVLPGIDPHGLQALKDQTSSGVLGLLDMFSGGAFSNASVFALGIMPYISASIVVQLLGIAVPYFQRLQKEGESGRRKINHAVPHISYPGITRFGVSYKLESSGTGRGFCIYWFLAIPAPVHRDHGCRFNVCPVVGRENY